MLYMPENPTCTLSTGALKRDGFVLTVHDALESLHLINPTGVNQKYNCKNGNVETYNGLDYIPIVFDIPYTMEESLEKHKDCWAPNLNEHPDGEGYISHAATSSQPLCRCKRLIQQPNNVRKSSSIKKLPMKFRDLTISPQHPKHNQKNIVSKVLPKKSVPPFPPKVIDVPRSISTHSSNRSDSLDSPHVTNAKSHKKSTVVIDPTIYQIYLQSILTHFKFGCKNMKDIIHMAQH